MIPELTQLETINQELETSSNLTRSDLLERNLIRESQEAVYRVGSTNGPGQQLPFTKLYLPMACTGILEPKKAVDETHRAIQILLPGTGTTFSVAETLCDVAGTFHGRKSKNRGAGRKTSQSLLAQVLPDGENFRVASFPTDLPLNGMGTGAPFEFADKTGLMLVLRHVHLILAHLYPNRPVFVVGRSQGGIAAILYAQSCPDVAGAIAVNPPHPDPILFDFTIKYLEDKASILADLLHAPGVSLHQQSWDAYKTFTPSFDYPAHPSLAPILTFVSLGDPFNLFPEYAEAQKEFAEKDEKNQVHILDAGHNLWDRKQEETYQQVISLHAQFVLTQLSSRQ
ncbi:MAG: alpha/beta hydrolase [Cyanothece sp. SIO2G6]|nr:alpha/beta hydrolase [Cyanothece sp. SIO2G6]